MDMYSSFSEFCEYETFINILNDPKYASYKHILEKIVLDKKNYYIFTLQKQNLNISSSNIDDFPAHKENINKLNS